MYQIHHPQFGEIWLNYEPVDSDYVRVPETGLGLVAVYPTQTPEWELQAILDEELKRTDIVVVFYHRDLWLTRDDIITQDELVRWYHGEHIPQEKKYRIFDLSALIHGSVHLSLRSSFPEDPGRWDTSTAGAILVKCRPGLTYGQAFRMANNFVDNLNKLFNGEYLNVVSERLEQAEDRYQAVEEVTPQQLLPSHSRKAITDELDFQIKYLAKEYGEQLPLPLYIESENQTQEV